ncbi:glycerophosphodiester phosphodiesterase family protein [Arthrobacter sp. H35-D1]|uniref:glycerophosphodiester phosphodiesterase n=1 Tax=Arthrobacter sp. H35-D1 TaxID=3046202 RepID=UPI0024BB7EAA|nr:glycerophosphodiester phosphodiesterase family protein [Arthrobacter sp. H35-D1]MDJ0312248.1 glycerophosphodiester phosphodiesterase family protein [Arthrobacter sp. H35-D1]
MTVQIYAHRGSSAAFAEHTRAAYLQALTDGADGVECDVQLSADGELVLLHDETVDRTSSGTGPVAELTLAQLRELDFSSWHGADLPPACGTIATQLLTLPELLHILAGAGRPVGLAIEFKYGEFFDPALVDAALRALRRHGWAAAGAAAGNIHVSFMSFHPEAVEYLAERIPGELLCQLLEIVEADRHSVTAAGEKLLDDGVAHLAGPGIDYLRENPANAARWLEAGRVLRVWTVDTAEDLQLCLANGAAEVTSNIPGEIRSLPTASPPK